MGHLLIEYESDRPPGGGDSSDRHRTLRFGKAPRVKWLQGEQSRDGRVAFSDGSRAFTIIHDSFGQYEMRIEAISPNRPQEDLAFDGAAGFTGDVWARAWMLSSVVNQGIPFRLTLDDFSSDENPPTTPRRRMETALIDPAAAGQKDIHHQDKFAGVSIATGGDDFDGFVAGDVVFLEDILDPTRFEFNKITTVTDSQNVILTTDLTHSFESGALIRHAFFFPKCLGTALSFAERSGRKSPQVEVWDLTVKFVTLRDAAFFQYVEA